MVEKENVIRLNNKNEMKVNIKNAIMIIIK